MEIEKYIKGEPISTEGMGLLVGASRRYKTNIGEISCVHPYRATMDSFEIFCIEGSLFEDIERYDTLEETEEKITELLTDN